MPPIKPDRQPGVLFKGLASYACRLETQSSGRVAFFGAEESWDWESLKANANIAQSPGHEANLNLVNLVKLKKKKKRSRQ